jgi:hypothetical protein
MSIRKETMSALDGAFSDLEYALREARREMIDVVRVALEEQAAEIIRLDDECRALELAVISMAWGDAQYPEGYQSMKPQKRGDTWGVLFTLAGGTTVWGAGGILFAEPQSGEVNLIAGKVFDVMRGILMFEKINLKKYDGHTLGPWSDGEDESVHYAQGDSKRLDSHYYNDIFSEEKDKINESRSVKLNRKYIIECDSGVYGPYGADRVLIINAPLLLDHLKKAYAEIDRLKECMNGVRRDRT